MPQGTAERQQVALQKFLAQHVSAQQSARLRFILQIQANTLALERVNEDFMTEDGTQYKKSLNILQYKIQKTSHELYQQGLQQLKTLWHDQIPTEEIAKFQKLCTLKANRYILRTIVSSYHYVNDISALRELWNDTMPLSEVVALSKRCDARAEEYLQVEPMEEYLYQQSLERLYEHWNHQVPPKEIMQCRLHCLQTAQHIVKLKAEQTSHIKRRMSI